MVPVDVDALVVDLVVDVVDAAVDELLVSWTIRDYSMVVVVLLMMTTALKIAKAVQIRYYRCRSEFGDC